MAGAMNIETDYFYSAIHSENGIGSDGGDEMPHKFRSIHSLAEACKERDKARESILQRSARKTLAFEDS